MSAVKAKDPMTDPRPGELRTLVNTKTGQRVTVYPVDAAEYRDPKRNPEHGDWVPEEHPRAQAGAAETQTPDPAPAVQTPRDLIPEPAPLPGEAKAGRRGQ